MTNATIQCSACGACVDAACDCGAAYVTAGTRAKAAIAKTPEKSDRSIAAEIGVGHATVSRAREQVPVSGETPRIGQDGKQYPAKKTRQSAIASDDDAYNEYAVPATPKELHEAFRLWADTAASLAKYTGKVDDEILRVARIAASAWSRLVETMEVNVKPKSAKPTPVSEETMETNDNLDPDDGASAWAVKRFLFAVDGDVDAAREVAEYIESVSLSDDAANSLVRGTEKVITAWKNVIPAINNRRTKSAPRKDTSSFHKQGVVAHKANPELNTH